MQANTALQQQQNAEKKDEEFSEADRLKDSRPPDNGHVRQNDERWKRLSTMAQAKVEELQ